MYFQMQRGNSDWVFSYAEAHAWKVGWSKEWKPISTALINEIHKGVVWAIKLKEHR